MEKLFRFIKTRSGKKRDKTRQLHSSSDDSIPTVPVTTPTIYGSFFNGYRATKEREFSRREAGTLCTEISGPKITILSGNIALAKADVIVSTTHPCLDLQKGAMSRRVLEHAGDSIQQELQVYLEGHGRPQLGQVVYTSGGKLLCRYIYHLSLPKWADDEGEVLKCAVEKCLDMATTHKASSIAFPTLGVGFLGYPIDKSASILFEAINSWYLNNSNTCLQDVQLIVFLGDSESLKIFNLESTRFSPQEKGLPVSHQSRPTIRITSGDIAKTCADVIVITVHPCLDMKRGTMSQSVLQCGGESIQEELLTYLHTNGRAQMGEVVCTSGGELQCQYVYHLSLPMWQEDKGQTLISAVEDCLDLAKQHAAKSIAFPTLGAGYLKYPVDDVAMILLSTIYSWVDSNPGVCLKEVNIVVFSEDTASLQAFNAATVGICERKGLKLTKSSRHQGQQAASDKKEAISQPHHWEPMNGENVKLVDLDPASTEYQQVVKRLEGMTITKIQRVQNPTLYQQYQMKKKDLESNNASSSANEQQLWHGTNVENISSIITNGFNRGFCGQNGTSYGQGVYFATRADYSKNYTDIGTLFLALVLVGESTPGNPKLRVPPKKPGSERLYDSLSGPDMAVIFHDAQAYPQYLVTLSETDN